MERWTAHKKAVVLAVLDCGLMTETEIKERWDISPEELAEWTRNFDFIGSPEGLKATRRVRRPKDLVSA
jgi:hypothetical protein